MNKARGIFLFTVSGGQVRSVKFGSFGGKICSNIGTFYSRGLNFTGKQVMEGLFFFACLSCLFVA